MNLFKNLININDSNSISTKVRQENFEFFKMLATMYEEPVKVLDLGGTEEYWKMMKYTRSDKIEVTLVNLCDVKVTLPNFKSIDADALELDISKFNCDIIFSHSLIEHVNHERFAKLINTCNKSYFIQTPNKYFPMEPHFLIPLLQFMPLRLKIWIVKNFRKELEPEVETINLLSKSELEKLFPDAFIHKGKIFGLTQSFVVTKRIR